MSDIVPQSAQKRGALIAALREVQAHLETPSELTVATEQRDQFARMWDDVMQNVLDNLQHIRADYRNLLQRLDVAEKAGMNDTERILEAIKVSTNQIVDAILQTKKKPSPPTQEGEHRQHKGWFW